MPQLFSVKQCASILGITPAYIRILIRSGVIPAMQFKAGGKYLMDIARVQRGIAARPLQAPQYSRNAVWMLLCRGKYESARRIYASLPPTDRAWIDAKCKGRRMPTMKTFREGATK